LSKKKEKIKLKNALIVQQEQTINQINENCDKYIRKSNQSIWNFHLKLLNFSKLINSIINFLKFLKFLDQKEIDNQEIRINELENQVNEYKQKLIECQKIIESNNSSIFFYIWNHSVIFIFEKWFNIWIET